MSDFNNINENEEIMFDANAGLENPIISGEENVKELSYEDIMHMAERVSGRDIDNNPKAVIGYQFFAAEDDEDSIDKNNIYNITRGHVDISMCALDQNFYAVDIIFTSADEPELKLLWGRLQRFKRMQQTQPEKTWMFYFNIMETGSVTAQTFENDKLLTCNIFNPTLFFLSREVPNFLCEDRVNEETGELYGGNMIRMLVPSPFVSFQIRDDIDTSEIKGEVMREISDAEFLDNSGTNNNQWDE